MRHNTIARIVVYSVLIVVLSCILVSGICAEFLMAQLATSDNVPTEGYAAGTLHRLQIHWNGGSVIIRQGKGDGFAFYETKPDGCWYRMEYECEDDTLSIHYSESNLYLSGLPEKDLVIQVPENWGGEEIQIHATGSVISIENIDVNRLKLSGTGYEVYYSGAVMQLDAKGTGTKLTLNCTNRPNAINFDGIGSSIQLKLADNCGFSVETGGIGCHMATDLTLKEKDGKQTFGNGECAIFIKGIGSNIHIANSGKCAHVWTEFLFPTGPDQNILIYTCILCGITKTEPDNHEHLWKDISETPEHPNFICSICGITRLDPIEKEYTIWITGNAATNYKRYWGTAQPYSTVTYKTTVTPTGVSIKGMLLHVDDTTYEGTLSDDGFYVFEFLMPPHDVIIWAETVPALKE